MPAHAQIHFAALKGEARERILRVALVEFAQRGFDGVSTTEIAKAANVTQPLIHYHFKNKEALWRATADELFVSFYREMKDMLVLDPHRAPETQMAEMIRHYIEFSARNPEWTRFIVREGSKQTDRLLWLAETWIRPLLLKISSIYSVGANKGWLKEIPLHQMLALVLSAGSLYAVAPMVDLLFDNDSSNPEEIKRYVNLTTQMLCNAFLVKPASEWAEV